MHSSLSAVGRNFVALAAALSMTAPFAARAQAPATQLADLNYQDVGWSRGELAKRGYQKRSQDGSGYEYWWNGGSSQCVVVRAEGGKVLSVTNTSPIDCGEQASNATSGDNKAAAAVAVGALALLGIAAMEHKSHHHDDNRHDDSSNTEADFERGYRDGLYNQPYNANQASTQYGEGYSSGQKDRVQRTSYRGQSGSGASEVTCESKNGGRNECDMDTAGSVRVVRQLSKAACTQGVSWGLSRHSVWVDNGCRAVFRKD